ncbi:hypothetical protein [Sellimonas sp.]|uniref:hypothetical protein n=1 Tax=Sellimonas sp. TaxID=2021466 RepID=UPI00257D95C9|nr:hypothetical protein [Sellimonas sp.]
MQELEKIIEKMKEIKDGNRKEKIYTKYPPNGRDQEILNAYSQGYEDGTDNFYNAIVDNIRKHMNDGWISVDEPPKKDYIAVFAVDKHDYYFVAVYDKEHGYRTNDVGADVDNIVAYCLFNLYRPERSEE